MHAYLIVGANEDLSEKKAVEIAREKKSKIIPQEISKIDDVRDLAKTLRLKNTTPLTILIKNFQNATNQAQNAFLKHLEEPQENVSIILFSKSKYQVASTILSRCEVVLVSQEKQVSKQKAEDFLKQKAIQRLSTVSSIKERDEANKFVEKLITSMHSLLISKDTIDIEKERISKAINVCNITYKNLQEFGNINLQLANLAINL